MVLIRAMWAMSLRRMHKRAPMLFLRDWRLWVMSGAYGKASFTGVGQQARVQAMTKPDDGAAYRTKQNSGFGTWVWVFRRSEQSKQAQEYLIGDWISPFMEATESNTSRRKLEVMSTVTEHSADIGAELSDTITVSGFPADHGQYAGNEEYEFAADRPYATVSVWWSGDPDNPSNDERTSHLGRGSHGRRQPPVAGHLGDSRDERHVQNRRRGVGRAWRSYVSDRRTAGWYVFVWRFEGDDRVSPASSRYDDAWERVRVLPHASRRNRANRRNPRRRRAGGGNHAQPSPVTARHGWRCVACLGSGRVSSGDRRHTVHRRSVRRRYDRFKHWTMRWPIR